ncbi:MYXO-CTERM sorting domain-containing protein [Nannocystis punicea]|uniref:MYXO-CTERM sorting domain-containing protein n=1 Tax=Nannocystis punicea TaxID=2995304 RepID=A0ABY7HI29_9BACT|nr:MYXO-CTERM sorting domain-containing protein [Nannocystis poenicansa]WAS98881.1 MYXO-CTERM sorting domain-containing protein [Nannocystis poenicansa]
MAVNSSSLQAMTLALAGAALLFPAEAEACTPDPCAYSGGLKSLEPLNAQAIPTDGVLLLQVSRFDDSPVEDWLDTIDLTVTRDGQPIAGAVEGSEIRNLLIWQPAAPLEPGDYQVVGDVDNPGDDYCAYDLELDFGFTVEAEPSMPLVPPLVEREVSVDVHERTDLLSLVCCEGAMPQRFDGYCGSSEHVGWEEGFCAVHQGFGVLRVEMAIDTKLPLATSAMVVRQLVVDGEPRPPEFDDALQTGAEKPFCTAVQLTNLATGETVTSEEACHGNEPEILAQLGDQAIDPAAELLENCSTPAYTCEIAESADRWDPEQCTPWPTDDPTGGDPTEGPTTDGPGSGGDETGDETDGPASGGQDGLVEHGCACDSQAPSPLGALMLLGLGLLRPRRRRRAG